VALIYGLLVTVVVMPAIRGGVPGDLVSRYDYLGSSVPTILAGLVTRPDLVVAHLLSPGPVLAIVLLLGGMALLPLARPTALLAAVPALLLALLSQKWTQETLLDQYGLEAGPLVFAAAVLGWARLKASARARRLLPILPGALAVGTVLALVAGAPTLSLGPWHASQDAESLAAQLPPGAPIEASADLLPVLAERPSIEVLGRPDAEYVAVDASYDASPLESLPGAGYLEVGSWGDLSLWQLQRYVGL
jgi:hypothetical protein